jgi:heme-degrading monooxygenase HmoA
MSSHHPKHLLEIAHFHHDIEDGTSSKLEQAERTVSQRHRAVLRTTIQPPGNVIALFEHDNAAASTPSAEGNLIKSLRSSLGEPVEASLIALDKPALGEDGPATAAVTECAQSWFPSSSASTDFRQKIEQDFLSFDEACQGVKGNTGYVAGWTVEECRYETIDGPAVCFVVLRGWESMADFEAFVATDAFKKAAPILFSWKAPFAMVGTHITWY